MIVTYDEHGGFFDHVPPLQIRDRAGGRQFVTTGVRVPAFLVSPHVAAGTPFRGKLDHTSILQLLADRFTRGQPYSAAVSARQQRLDPLRDVFVQPLAELHAPEFPESLGAAMHVAAATAPVPPVGPGAPKDTETAKAFDRVAHELAVKHPEVLATRPGRVIAAYVAGTAPTGGALPALAPAAVAPAAVRPIGQKPRRRAKKAAKAGPMPRKKARARVKPARRKRTKRKDRR